MCLVKFTTKFLYKGESINNEYPFIPIGFLPSNVISNWYLAKFDKAVKENITPLYYARYVDDILLVFSSIDDIQEETVDGIISKFINIDIENCPIIKHKKTEDYLIPTSVLPLNAEELVFKGKKAKVYSFSYTDSRELIERFKERLKEQSSFRQYLRENDKSLLEDLYRKIQKIIYSDSPNKPRSIEGISLDKLELSKWLSFLLYFSGNIESKDYKRLKKVLIDTLADLGIIKYFTFWQRYLSVFFYYKDYDSINDVLKLLQNVILNLESKVEADYFLPNNSDKLILKETLINYFYCCLRRVLCLRDDKTTNELITRINEQLKNHPLSNLLTYEEKLVNDSHESIIINDEVRISYLNSFLFDLKLTDFPLGNYKLSKNKMYDIFDTKNRIYSQNNRKNNSTKLDKIKKYSSYLEYYPVFIHFHEFLLLCFEFPFIEPNHLISKNRKSKIIKEENYLRAFKLFYWVNFGVEPENIDNFKIPKFDDGTNEFDINQLFEFKNINKGFLHNGDIESLIIRIGRKINRKEIRIGIANVKLDENCLENKILNDSRLNSDRRNIASNIINNAIKEKVDLLILPECYINYEWLHKLIRVSKDNQMGMIFGLEHILDDETKTAYNFIVSLLPFKIDIFNNCAIDIRLKNHYAPREKEKIEESEKYHVPNLIGENIGAQYCLFSWNGLSFSSYCCYEIADIVHRSIFKSYLDALIVVEWNKDIEYFSSIVESLSRDLHCYLIQVNSSDYGDSRITQPASYAIKDIVRAKGGRNAYLIVEDIDINELRKFQKMDYQLQKKYSSKHNGKYKFTPPGFDKSKVDER